jgi:hypothetical protein
MIQLPVKLTDSEKLYCSLRAEGNIPKYQCYMDSFRTNNKASAYTLSTRLEKRSEVKNEIERLQRATESKKTLSRREKREFLARIVRADPKNLRPEDSDLADSVTHYYDKSGALQKTVLKLPSKAECVKLDNQMAGHNEPEEINVNHGGGIMLVPVSGMNDDLEAWEKAAEAQQVELMQSEGE